MLTPCTACHMRPIFGLRQVLVGKPSFIYLVFPYFQANANISKLSFTVITRTTRRALRISKYCQVMAVYIKWLGTLFAMICNWTSQFCAGYSQKQSETPQCPLLVVGISLSHTYNRIRWSMCDLPIIPHPKYVLPSIHSGFIFFNHTIVSSDWHVSQHCCHKQVHRCVILHHCIVLVYLLEEWQRHKHCFSGVYLFTNLFIH